MVSCIRYNDTDWNLMKLQKGHNEGGCEEIHSKEQENELHYM